MLLSQSVGAPGHTVDIIITTMIHSFIHSGIYIAPLQGNYSEALPTPTRPKRTVLSLVRKVSGRLPGCRRSSRGRPFQIIGPATEKARFCIVAVRAKGTIVFIILCLSNCMNFYYQTEVLVFSISPKSCSQFQNSKLL